MEVDELDAVYERLEQHAPAGVAQALHWLRDPRARPVRLPLGVLCVGAGLVGPFVPLLGIEFLPVGLLLLAEDVPALRRPVADLSVWLERQWKRINAGRPGDLIVHETGTRIRVRPSLPPAALEAAGSRIAALPGVVSVRPNATARCLVVQYDGQLRTRGAILACLT